MNELQEKKENPQLLKLVEDIKPKLFSVDDSNVKQAFNDNYLKLLCWKHRDKPKEYIIDFLHKAQLSGADPRKDQIYLVGFKNKKGEFNGSVVYSYHFFINQANQTGQLEGIECETNLKDVFDPIKNKVISELVSTATISRKGREPSIFNARWSEFAQRKYDGSYTKSWNEKPYIMLQKCAIANALRWQFPESLSGMFIEEEMGFHETVNEDFKEKEDKKTSIEADFKNVEEKELDFNIIDVGE